MSDLEDKFRAAYDDAIVRLTAKNDEAVKLMREIEAISEETGIPFYASVSPLSQRYKPNPFQEKWGETMNETVEKPSWDGTHTYKVELFGAVTGGYPGEYEGWQHSAVCY